MGTKMIDPVLHHSPHPPGHLALQLYMPIQLRCPPDLLLSFTPALPSASIFISASLQPPCLSLVSPLMCDWML